jgi:hypothetical protein
MLADPASEFHVNIFLNIKSIHSIHIMYRICFVEDGQKRIVLIIGTVPISYQCRSGCDSENFGTGSSKKVRIPNSALLCMRERNYILTIDFRRLTI